MILSEDDMKLLLETVNETVASHRDSTKQERSERSRLSRKLSSKLSRSKEWTQQAVAQAVEQVESQLGAAAGVGSKFGAANQLISGNPDEAVYGLNHFMGVRSFESSGIEQVEGERLLMT